MIDKNKFYSYKELLDMYSMLNIEFKYYGHNDKGNILLHLMTRDNKILVFSSDNNGKSKYDYLHYSIEDIENLNFKYEMEVEMQDYNINVIVNTSTCEKIPSGRYSITTLDKMTKENDDFIVKDLKEDQINGLAYMVVEKNSNTNLFSGVYEFGKGGFLYDLEYNLLPAYQNAKNKIAVSNIREILNLFKNNELDKEMVSL